MLCQVHFHPKSSKQRRQKLRHRISKLTARPHCCDNTEHCIVAAMPMWKFRHLFRITTDSSTRTWVYRTCHEHLNACRNFRSLNPERGVVLASCIHMSTPCARLEYVASTLHRSRSFICWLTTLGSANVVAESSRIKTQDSCELIAKFPATTCSESAMSHFQLLVLHLSRDNHQVASSLRNRAGKTVPSFLFLILVTSVHANSNPHSLHRYLSRETIIK